MFLRSTVRLALLDIEELMQELNGDGTLAHCRRDTFDGAISGIPRGEHTRHARFE
jgi:hypothetical protein